MTGDEDSGTATIENGVQFDELAVPRRSLAETAYQLIKRAIIRCDLEPGQQITEEQLAQRFEIGRSAIRPALKRLYQERLVQTASRQRYVIPPITLKDTHDLFELRLLLEPEAARLAASRITEQQLARLQQLSDVQYQMGDPESAESFLRANTEFHVTVAEASGNAIMVDVIANLLDRAERLNHLSHQLHDRNVVAYHEHHDLVDALRAGQSERAYQVMRDQIQAASRFVIDALTSSPSIQFVNVTGPANPTRRTAARNNGEK